MDDPTLTVVKLFVVPEFFVRTHIVRPGKNSFRFSKNFASSVPVRPDRLVEAAPRPDTCVSIAVRAPSTTATRQATMSNLMGSVYFAILLPLLIQVLTTILFCLPLNEINEFLHGSVVIIMVLIVSA